MPLEETRWVPYKRREKPISVTRNVSHQPKFKGLFGSSYCLDKVVEDSIDVLLANVNCVIRTYQQQIKEIRKIYRRIMAGLTQTLEIHSWNWSCIAAGIIAEIGQSKEFEWWNQG